MRAPTSSRVLPRSIRPVTAAAAARALVVAAGLALALPACASDDDGRGADPAVTEPAVTEPAVTEPTVSGPATDAATDPVDATSDGPDATDPDATEPAGIDVGEVPVTEPTLPEIGVPGLDADDVVCRAWSRFAGSFQVAAVAAAFADDPLDAARLEIVAAPVVAAAVADMEDNWPEALADEAEPALDGYIGPYARRSAQALETLVESGADDDALERLAAAWLDALAVRDAGEILPVLDLPADLAALVEVAAVEFDDRRVPIPADPSLVTDVEIPATEQFIVETCPDRGTLAGGELID